MKNFTTRLQRDITTNHPIFLTNRSKLLVFVKICKKSLGTDRLQNTTACGYDDLTTTYEGNRNPYSSGIFLSQIFLSQGIKIFFTPLKAEFVKWLISGNKASNRTNNASHSYVAVETISHPFKQGGNLLLTKPYEKITMLFKFLFTGSRLRITVFANNLAEAYKRLPLSQSKPVLIARLPVQGGVYA